MLSSLNSKNIQKKQPITLLSVSKACLVLFFAAKPIYIFSSGAFQIGDGFLILSFSLLLIHKKFNFDLFKKDVLYLIFVVCTFAINTIYYINYNGGNYLVWSLYYLYNLFGIITFRYFCNDKNLLKIICYTLRIWLFVEVALMIIGVGRWYSADRYMGSFNDPNQLAIYVLMSFYFIKIYSKIKNIRNYYLDDLCVLFLVYQSSSTGAVIGIVSYYLFLYIDRTVFYATHKKIDKLFLLFAISFFVVLVFWTVVINSSITSTSEDASLLSRLHEKFSKFIRDDGFDIYQLFKDRNMTRILDYPQYFLYGSGEGNAAFGVLSSYSGEIHSTLIGIFYYYGLIPFVIFGVWFIRNIKPSFNGRTWVMGASLICESFILANQRQPLFWMIFVLSSSAVRDTNLDNSSCKRLDI